MDLKPLPIAAALVGGGVLTLIAGSASVAQMNKFAPAGLCGAAAVLALAMAKPGNGDALRAFGYSGLGLTALFGYAGYQAYKAAQPSATTTTKTAGNLGHGQLAQMAGHDLHTIVGYWISQNVAPPQQGGLHGWSRSQMENDMTGRRQPNAWGGRARP